MRSSIRGLCAIFGSALIAFSLCGSTWRPHIHTEHSSRNERALFEEGRRLYQAGEFARASGAFRSAALQAEQDRSPGRAAMNWSNAGGAELAHLNYRTALPFFLKAREIARIAGLPAPMLAASNNLASLYLEMGDPNAALRIASDSLRAASAETGFDDRLGAVPRLRFQLATALARLGRFDEAEPVYRQAIEAISAGDDLESTARVLSDFGIDCLDNGRLDEADAALSEALYLIRLHRLHSAGNALHGLAKLRARQGDTRSAAALFDAAIEAPPGMTARWEIYTDRGEFRIAQHDLPGALDDFRKAHHLAAQMRADIVPADRDRVTLEGNLSRITAGLIEAGNRLEEKASDPKLLRETFDAAEQDRAWSLRALFPSPGDWRTHLPDRYWDVLARSQSVARSMIESETPELRRTSLDLQLELQRMEAAAANESHDAPPPSEDESVLAHVRRTIDPESVLFSFHVARSGRWLWAADRQGVDVWPVPSADVLQPAIADFNQAIRNGAEDSRARGYRLYKMLFGEVSSRYLSHRRWLLELDGPLYDLSFAALVVEPAEPTWLFERAVLETVPGALLLEPRRPIGSGPFLGVGDPVYNPADPRYHGARPSHGMFLPRLADTAAELDSCSRAWHAGASRILTGSEAGIDSVRAALRAHPSIIHFATHVVRDSGGGASGLIALSLDPSGSMALMGPDEIVAYPVAPSLVVLNGCHSDAGAALPGTGLMGLTRAWMATGARSVVATLWDVPDDAAASLMTGFYQALRAQPQMGAAFALQQAQEKFLKGFAHGQASDRAPAVWGAWFVVGRE